MMKNHHLKMYIDRLMLVPRTKSIDQPGAEPHNKETPDGDSLFDDLHDPHAKNEGMSKVMDRDHLPEEAGIHDERDDGDEPELEHTPSIAKHDDEENPGKSGIGKLLSQSNPSKGDHKAEGSGLHGIKAPSKSKPQSVTEPHAMLKEGSLNSEDHEKHVKMERARHARIFGD